VLSHLPSVDQAALTGREFFPRLISEPFQASLHTAFAFAIIACLVAAVASWSRGKRYVDEAPAAATPRAVPAAPEARGQ
jgi:hypothetical protein